MNSIAVLLLLALIALGWWNAVGARSSARNAARKACNRAGVAFIDELALQRLSIGRDPRALLCLNRVYGFEFFVHGNVRYAGQVEMRARYVAAVRMDPYPETSVGAGE